MLPMPHELTDLDVILHLFDAGELHYLLQLRPTRVTCLQRRM